VVVLPSFCWCLVFHVLLLQRFEFHVGEKLQGRLYFYTLVLPSVRFFGFIFCFLLEIQMSGRIHRSEFLEYLTLVLPSMNRNTFLRSCFCFNLFMSGRFTGDPFYVNSRSPPCVFRLIAFCLFTMGPLMTWHSDEGLGWRWPPHPILYIYSLRHFLTTKGALIDGDGYPPKNPKNDPKNHSKMTNFSWNLRSKNDQKQWFLMAKSTFSLKSLKNHPNWSKNH